MIKKMFKTGLVFILLFMYSCEKIMNLMAIKMNKIYLVIQ